MSGKGRPRKPTAKLKLYDDARARQRADEPQPPAASVQPPPGMDGDALAFWNEYAPRLLAIGLLTEVDRPQFVQACDAWAEYQEARREIVKGGSTFTVQSGYSNVSPWVTIRNNSRKTCANIMGKFGMTPSERAGLEVEKPKSGGISDFARKRGA